MDQVHLDKNTLQANRRLASLLSLSTEAAFVLNPFDELEAAVATAEHHDAQSKPDDA